LLYSVLFVVGLLGNLLVLWVILKGSQIKSLTDVSLLNLIISDLLLISTLPFLAHYARDQWVFGSFMCTLVLSVYHIGFYAGIFFIVLMGIDRYLAIVHAVFSLRIRTKTYGILASIFIWILAVASSFPELLYLGVLNNETKTLCSAYPKNNYNNIKSGSIFKMNVLGLLIPLSILGFCYFMIVWRLRTLRSSTKLAIRLVVVVMVVFFCCWIPYNIAAFLKALELKRILTPECELNKTIQLLLQITEAVAFSHSCLNPFLYVLVGPKFRKHLARLLLQTPCSHVQCMKHCMTQLAASVYVQTTMLYSVFFVVGLLANMLVLWVILRGTRIKSMNDVSLLNLVISDLLLISTLPFLAHYARDQWVFGSTMCILVLSVYHIVFYAGIFFIVLMSIDRYLAIVHAISSLRIRTKTYGILASIFIWILAVASSFPELLYLGVIKNGNETLCSAPYPEQNHHDIKSGSFFKMNVLGLLIPLIIVGFCYSMVLRKLQTLRNSKKLAVRLVIVVMVVFFCCWIPYNIAAFLKALELKHILPPGCELSKTIQLLLQVTEAVAYSHSCLNPFIYMLVGEKFRR
ncbi:C-C chemokine receptor type 5-like, partial [Silurus asotus]